VVKKFLRPILFLLGACAILLVSDLANRKSAQAGNHIFRLAVFRFNSNQVLEETEGGFLHRIEQSKPYKEGRLEIKRYSAEGDMPTANTIARNIISQKYNLVVSISTPGLQIMANANRKGEIPHLFCAVTDPYVSGVGITGTAPDQHPPHLAGIGSFQPVEETFRIAKMMFPGLKKVGVVWCMSETCSEACTKKARIISKDLGIELEEKSVESVSQVYEAAITLCSDRVQALWIGGDNVVEPAIGVYVSAGLKFGVPVMTNNPMHAFKGAMLNLGANYGQIGEATADMALDVINGKSIADFEVKEMVPQRLFINDSIRRLLKDPWNIPPELVPRIDSLIR
jgi:putative ABC transport system substrate-binding protein